MQLAVPRALPSQAKDSFEESGRALSVQLSNVPASQATEGPNPYAAAGRAVAIEAASRTKDTARTERTRFQGIVSLLLVKGNGTQRPRFETSLPGACALPLPPAALPLMAVLAWL